MQEGVDEITAKSDGDDESDEGVCHGRASEPTAAGGVGAHYCEAAETKDYIDEIEHMLRSGCQMNRNVRPSRSNFDWEFRPLI